MPRLREGGQIELDQLELTEEILKFRIAGLSVPDIATRVGYGVTRVRELLADALRLRIESLAEHLRQLEMERYELLIQAYFPKALQGDTKAANVVLRTITDERRMNGVDKPLAITVTTAAADIDAAMAELTNEMRRRAGLESLPG